MTETEVLALSPQALRHQHRGDFSVIAILLRNKNPSLDEVALYQALQRFVDSTCSKSYHDWDRLLSALFLPPEKTVLDFFTQEAVWKECDEYSPLLDAIAPCLVLTPTQQGALNLKRAYMDVLNNQTSVIQADNTMAFYVDLSGGVEPNVPFTHHPQQLNEIRQYLITMNTRRHQDVQFLKALMGPCFSSAIAKAHQFFYHPVNLFMRQCFWLLFQAVQEEGKKTRDPLTLDHALKHLLTVYSKTYPNLSAELTEKTAFLFADKALATPLIPTLMALKAALDADNPLLVDLLFMPTPFHQPQEYCLRTIEQAYIEDEKSRFKAETMDFLNTATLSQKNQLRQVFSVHHQDNVTIADTITQIHTHLRDEEYQWFLIPAVHQQSIAFLFLAHGAQFLNARHGGDWSLLKEALKNHRPKDSTDELFRQALLTYCDEDHHIDRFETIRYALKVARTKTPLVDTVLNNAGKKIPFYRRNPRLLNLAKHFKAMKTDAIGDSVLVMPAFLAPLPEYQDFNAQLKFCRLANEDFEEVCAHLPESLYDGLDLRGVPLTPKKARDLFYGLMDVCPKNLILSQPFEEYGHTRTRKNRSVFEYLIRSLPYYQGLEALHADNTQLTDKTLLPFMEKLVKVKSVIILTLRHNFITDTGLLALSQLIQNSRRARKWFKNLTVLDFSANLITDAGVIALKEALKDCQELSIEWGDNLAISSTVKENIQGQVAQENLRISASSRDSERLSNGLRPSLTRNSLLTRDEQSIYSGITSRESLTDAFQAKRSQKSFCTSEKSGSSLQSDNSPRSINRPRLSFSEATEAVIKKVSSSLSIENQHLLRFSITNKVLSIPNTILEEDEPNLTGLSEFIEEEEIQTEEVIIPKKVMTATEFKKLLESLCTLENLKKLDIAKVTVIPDENDTTVHPNVASPLIHELVSVLPKFQTLETVNFGTIKLSEENLKKLIDIVPETSIYFKEFIINGHKKNQSKIRKLDEAFFKKSEQYALLKKSLNVQEHYHNTYIRQSLKPCAIIRKNSLPNTVNWVYHHNNGIDFYYVVFMHPKMPRQLFFVNQEKAVSIKKINYHLKEFFEWLDTQLPQLKNAFITDEVIPLTDEQLLAIRDIIQHNYLEEEKYRLIPLQDYTEQLAIRCHHLETMRDDRLTMEKIFFDATTNKNRHDYFHALYGGLCRLVDARRLLSTGLFSTAEKGALGTYANYVAGAVTAAFPVSAPVSVGVLLATDAIDSMERDSFNNAVATLSNQKNEEKEQSFFVICLLILLKHIDRCEEHELNTNLAKEEACQIVDFLTSWHSMNSPLFVSHEQVILLAKIPELMEKLFNDRWCILPLKKSDEQQAMESLRQGVRIGKNSKACLPMPDTFVLPFGYKQFADAKLPKSLREHEAQLRDCLQQIAKGYQERWAPKNFYDAFFIQNIQRHGGSEVLQLCQKLDNMAKTLPYYQLMEAIPAFLKELDQKSGKREGSLQTLLIKALLPEEPVPVKNCTKFLFLNENKKIDEQRQSIIDLEPRLSDSINNQC